MKILDKIKEILFGKKVKALPQSQYDNQFTQNSGQPQSFTLQRNDGTEVTITQMVDKVGNQLYEQVYSAKDNIMKCIPKYLIGANEITDIIPHSLGVQQMLMEIDIELLNNPYYADYIANNLLNKERMPKIIREYANYVGGINIYPDGRAEKGIDPSVINALKLSNEEKKRILEEERIKRDKETKAQILQNAVNIQPEYKKSHAEDLTKYER